MSMQANAGDSRCVIGTKGRAKPLSQDHKPQLEGMSSLSSTVMFFFFILFCCRYEISSRGPSTDRTHYYQPKNHVFRPPAAL